MISIKNLSKSFGRQQVLRGIDLEIPAGKIVGLVGENGAGKTTLMKCMMGMLRYSGSIRMAGRDPHREQQKLLQEVTYIPDVNALPGWMTGAQLTEYIRLAHGGFNQERYDRLLAQSDLPMNKRASKLSKGMRAKLYLLLILALDSRILILDEPTLGLDIIFRKQFFQTILEEFVTQEQTILISTHQVEEVENTLSDVIFIRDGAVQLNSELTEMQHRFNLLTMPDSPGSEKLPAGIPSPIQETCLLGNRIRLFDGVSRQLLEPLGRVSTPSLADIFVALNVEKLS
jgi:ABC-2 type transport system ATP-binding protein